MRIIAGKLGGQIFDSSARPTHPMSEKMRGAIFNSLGDIVDLNVLDLFAGTGAISFESISRGAKNATAVELNKKAQKDIEKNIKKLGLSGQVKLIKTNVFTLLSDSIDKFHIIVADPPYDHLKLDKLKGISKNLVSEGVLVLSIPPKVNTPTFEGLNIKQEKDYGDGKLVFYKNTL